MPDCRIVTVSGRIDAANTHHLHYALSRALHPDYPLIADLTRVTALDAAGLRALLLNQRNAELQGALLLLVPSPAVALAVGAKGTLTVCPDLADALIAARHNATAAHLHPGGRLSSRPSLARAQRADLSRSATTPTGADCGYQGAERVRQSSTA